MEMSKEDIIGISEAYRLYQILPKESQEKIPKEFVEKIEKYAKEGVGCPIYSPYSLKSEKISDEGVKLMAYMCLFLK